MELIGWFSTILIGVSLGLIGGGGSILTVPVLVYLFGTKASIATAYSLFVVGLTALIGSISYFRRGQIDVRSASIFVVPSVTSLLVTRRFLLPAIPENLGPISKDRMTILFFAVLMGVAAFRMIRPGKASDSDLYRSPSLFKMATIGLVVGLLAGLVGAGGGFLIIPALVLFAGLEMKTAIGTSLFIIGVQSLIGFLGDLGSGAVIEWPFLIRVAAFAVVGILIGSGLGKRIPGALLKPSFGWFVVAMAVFILSKEILF